MDTTAWAVIGVGVLVLVIAVIRRDVRNLAAGRLPWAMVGFVGGAVALVVAWLVMGAWYAAIGV